MTEKDIEEGQQILQDVGYGHWVDKMNKDHKNELDHYKWLLENNSLTQYLTKEELQSLLPSYA